MEETNYVRVSTSRVAIATENVGAETLSLDKKYVDGMTLQTVVVPFEFEVEDGPRAPGTPLSLQLLLKFHRPMPGMSSEWYRGMNR